MARNHYSSIGCALLLALGCSSSSNQPANNGGGNANGGGNTCPPGSETCACYGNDTCDQGLDCQNHLCVVASTSIGGSSAGGNANGGSNPAGGITGIGGVATGGVSATGGVVNTGSTQATGGTTAAAGGTKATGGTLATGGVQSIGGSQSTGGTSSAATCTNNTSNDPRHCGFCGHLCLNLGQADVCGTSCCVAGQCAPGFGPCFKKSDGFTTCAEACASIGSTCAQKGCGGYTWFGWNSISADSCGGLAGYGVTSNSACDFALPWTGESTTVRCCCNEPP